jgi:large subunit ribosomal protein L25
VFLGEGCFACAASVIDAAKQSSWLFSRVCVREAELKTTTRPFAACPEGEPMSDDTKVIAELRDSFGKGFARRLRAAGKIPAVLYGHGTEPVHVALPGHQVALIIRRANALLELDIEGKSQLALVKDVQKDPVHQIIEHIDLLVVKKGEKIQVDVPLYITGESFAGTIANLDATTLALEVEATHIPEHVEVSVEGLEEGAHITAADVKLPKGATLLADPELLIVAISVPAAEVASENDAEAESAEEASEEAAAE